MRMDIEDVEIHVRLLVEQRNFDDIKQNMYKKDENQKSKSIWAVLNDFLCGIKFKFALFRRVLNNENLKIGKIK